MREVGRFQASTTIRTWQQVMFRTVWWRRTDCSNTVVTYRRIFAGMAQPGPGPGSVPASITVQLYRSCAATLRDCVIFPAISPQSSAGRCCYLWCSQPAGGPTRSSVGQRATLHYIQCVMFYLKHQSYLSLVFLPALWSHP